MTGEGSQDDRCKRSFMELIHRIDTYVFLCKNYTIMTLCTKWLIFKAKGDEKLTIRVHAMRSRNG